MSLYCQNISLSEIFNNRSIRKKLPIGDFKEVEKHNKITKNGQLRIFSNQIKSISSAAASKYYKKVKVTRSNRTIIINGELKTSYSKAYNGIYLYVKNKSGLLKSLISSNEVLQTAWLEERKNVSAQKLYLKVSKIKEIKNMNANQLKSLLDDIIDNIRFTDNYPKAKQMLGEKQDANYFVKRQLWMKKVGVRNE